jgi:hypothetical protein
MLQCACVRKRRALSWLPSVASTMSAMAALRVILEQDDDSESRILMLFTSHAGRLRRQQEDDEALLMQYRQPMPSVEG